jgi:glutathione-independent formaldehyde dehydrogenase
MLKGASEVYVVDCIPERLAKAQEFGAIPIDFSKSDPVDQILAERKKRQEVQQSARPGEEKRKGVDCVIDAVGYQARPQEKSLRKFWRIASARSIRPAIWQSSVCISPLILERRIACSKTECFRSGSLKYSTSLFRSVAAGPVKRYNEYLRDLIISGKAKPGKIVSHHISIDDVPEAYKKFNKRIEGYTKVLIRMNESKISAASA